ncbi:MAG: hypothetical protein ACQESA_02700 [Patescibacteria group bacterium]
MKKYLPIIIALGTPLLFVIGVVIYVNFFIPTIEPQYDLILTDKERAVNVDTRGRIQIKDSLDNIRGIDSIEDIDLWRYSVKEDELIEITWREAEKLKIRKKEISPDEMEFEYRYPRSSIADLFGAQRDRGYYIFNEEGSKKLDIYGRYPRKEFVGWIIEY